MKKKPNVEEIVLSKGFYGESVGYKIVFADDKYEYITFPKFTPVMYNKHLASFDKKRRSKGFVYRYFYELQFKYDIVYDLVQVPKITLANWRVLNIYNRRRVLLENIPSNELDYIYHYLSIIKGARFVSKTKIVNGDTFVID